MNESWVILLDHLWVCLTWLKRVPARSLRRTTSAAAPGQRWRQRWDWMRETPRASCTPTVSSWCFERWSAATSHVFYCSATNINTWKKYSNCFPCCHCTNRRKCSFYLGQEGFFLLFPSIIIDCVSLLEVYWNNQDKWRSSTRGVL